MSHLGSSGVHVLFSLLFERFLPSPEMVLDLGPDRTGSILRQFRFFNSSSRAKTGRKNDFLNSKLCSPKHREIEVRRY